MILAKCVSLRYQSGSFALVQGVKKGVKDGFRDGIHFRNRGFGWGEEYEPSRLILTVEIKKVTHDIKIEQFWKSSLGRLTKKRQDIIISEMPQTIKVEKVTNQNGTTYLMVGEESLKSWLDRVRVKI